MKRLSVPMRAPTDTTTGFALWRALIRMKTGDGNHDPLGGAGWVSDLAACRAAAGAFDVASVCVPTAYHEAVLLELLDMPLRAVLAEKPLTGDVAQSQQIVDAYRVAGRPLAVNFLRRFDPVLATLRREIEVGDWGRLQSASVHYAKGIVNCGSHAIDLLHYFFGLAACLRI